jgi:hypothetical protein
MSNQKLSLREENNLLVAECRELFWELIEVTGEYFLSDCVEESSDYLSDNQYDQFIRRRNLLNLKCDRKGIDFHRISQDVSQEFLASQEQELKIEEVIDGLKEIYKTIHDKDFLNVIEQAILLIRTHTIED